MKYPRTYHLPISPGTTSDDRISKDVSSLIGRDIVFLEKLDGENNGQNNAGVYARSHSAFTISPWSREVRQLHSIIKDSIYEDLTIFGENMEGIHSIEYTKLESYFYMFGARENEKWFSWDDVEIAAYMIGVPNVPVLHRCTVNSEKELYEIVTTLVNGESKLGGVLPGTNIPAIEGLVVRITDEFHDKDFSKSVMKWVRKDHVNTTVHWAKEWKKAKLINR